MPAYDELAQYYNLVHDGFTADIAFYLALAREAGGPILELGCGTGRTLIPLVEAGFEVIGLDSSEAMLARARERAAAASLEDRATLMRGDMVGFDLGRRLSLVIVPFNTWMHLPDQEAQAAALHCIGRHLVPGGRLVIDLPAPGAIVDSEHDGALTLEGIRADPETGERVLRFASTRVDLESQVLYVTWIYDRVDSSGAVRRVVTPMELRYLYPHQAELLLEGAGLGLQAIWGDYVRSPYSSESERMIIVAGSAVS